MSELQLDRANWQTPKKPGTCHRVTMTTQDGSTLVALFKLK